jgi:hypothetical protein
MLLPQSLISAFIREASCAVTLRLIRSFSTRLGLKTLTDLLECAPTIPSLLSLSMNLSPASSRSWLRWGLSLITSFTRRLNVAIETPAGWSKLRNSSHTTTQATFPWRLITCMVASCLGLLPKYTLQGLMAMWLAIGVAVSTCMQRGAR